MLGDPDATEAAQGMGLYWRIEKVISGVGGCVWFGGRGYGCVLCLRHETSDSAASGNDPG